MRSILRVLAGGLFLFVLASLPFMAWAKAPGDSFRMTGSAVNAEGAQAEVCLTFSQPFDVRDRVAIAAALEMEKDGKEFAVDPRDLSLTPSGLCVQNLKHRHKYSLYLEDLHDQLNNPLEEPVDIRFTVPARRPSLSFMRGLGRTDFPRYAKTKAGDNHDHGDKSEASLAIALKAVNIDATQLTLYHIVGRKLFAAAWQQYAQINLAPSESHYFAAHNSQQVWQSDLVFKKSYDVEQKVDVPLPAREGLQPGLYYLAASPRAKAVNPGLYAGLWFLISDLRLNAVATPEGVQAFAADGRTLRAESGVEIQLLSKNGEILAEAGSDAEGMAKLLFEKEKRGKAAYLTGVTAEGDVDIVDLERFPEAAFMPPPPTAILAMDRAFYLPGSVATAALFSNDNREASQKTDNGTVKLLRPDQSVYSERQVSFDKAGVTSLSFPLPFAHEAGEWTFLWQREDGTVLAKQAVQLRDDAFEPKLEAAADRSLIEPDGFVALTIKATRDGNQPLAWRRGRVDVYQQTPEFEAWKKYRFGTAETPGKIQTVKFMTGADGAAYVRVDASLEGDSNMARAVALTVYLDGAPKPLTLTVPVRPSQGWVGIRSLQEGRTFAENSEAVFDVIALDPHGKRRAWGDLYFQIYEEGRSFEWFPAEGYWDYKPLPQHRRIGGGRLSLAAAGDNLLRWPVTAGHYVLEIATGDGVVLAQHGFDAGSGAVSAPSNGSEAFISVSGPKGPLEPEKPGRLTFKLTRPAMVNIMIGDDLVRQTIHRFMPAGENAIKITPRDNWGHRVRVRAQALSGNGDQATGQLILPVRQKLEFSYKAPDFITTGASQAFPVGVQKIARQKPSFVAALAAPVQDDGRSSSTSAILATAPVDRDGRALLRLNLPDFTGRLRLSLFAWNGDQFGTKVIAIPARPPLAVEQDIPDSISVGGRIPFQLDVRNNDNPEGKYNYTLTAPEGLKIEGAVKGTISLKRKQNRSLSLTLNGTQEGQGFVQVALTGPNNYRWNRNWPVAVRADSSTREEIVSQKIEAKQTVTLPLQGGRQTEALFSLVSPVPLQEAMRSLKPFLDEEPVLTEDIARWLEVARFWKEEITSYGFMSEASWQKKVTIQLERLQERQNEDGGFFAYRPGMSSDLASTSAALNVVNDESPHAAAHAVRWLQRRLENTWFEEVERPARAIAFLALAKSGHADLSALRYFADTSRDKTVSPEMAAHLAMALALGKDEGAARYWLERAYAPLSLLIASNAPEAAPLLHALGANPEFDCRRIKKDMETAGATEFPDHLFLKASFLMAVKTYLQRAGTWEIAVDKNIGKTEGARFFPLTGKRKTFVFDNVSEEPLYVTQIQKGKSKTPVPKREEPSLLTQREVYQLDGNLLAEGESLTKGEVYLMVLRGTGKKAKARYVTQTLPAGIEPVAMGEGKAGSFMSLWPWLSGPFTNVESAHATAEAIHFIIDPADAWQVVCLVRARRRGAFNMSSVAVRDPSGFLLKVTPNRQRFFIH